ncbi:DnaD domain-containing protein [Virgibacillus alimentarius]|uniref:DnaD/phage-associated family protein n=1 Tax=Virgibacillus alimentarius TaxID=698769 RepID=A0ABS4S6A3_9BACI|nr:DnaD domain protein [Virgibacillus alimentarius]MBP2257038.1 DnaD/phage-associated family protein [Virgibacillus alimentarius]
MNYIKELNAFREWLLTNELSTSAIALWYTLMSINNSARWKKRFNAPNAVVGQLSGLSKQGILDARKKLIEYHLIKCESGRKGKAPIYEFISLVNSADSSSYETIGESTDESLTIHKHKQKEIQRRKEERKSESILKVYEENIGALSPLACDEFFSWIEVFGEEVVTEAIKITAKHGGRTFSYMEKILKEWKKVHLNNLKDVYAYEAKKETSRNNTIPFRKQGKGSKSSVFDELREEVGL